MGMDQSNNDEEIIVYVTLIKNSMMEVRVESPQGDQNMRKYRLLLRINRSLMHAMEYTKKIGKNCPLTFSFQQPHENIFLVELLEGSDMNL